MIVKIVINVACSNVDQEYTYNLPKELEENAKIGARVIVNFGNSTRLVMGYILDIGEYSDYDGELKDIEEILDYEPLITKEQIELAKKIRDDAICPLVRVLNLMIPNALVLKTSKYLTIVNYKEIDGQLTSLFTKSNTIKYTKALWTLDSKIAKEVKKGNIKVSYEAKPVTTNKYIYKYVINPVFKQKNIVGLRSQKQIEFLESIEEGIAMTSFELMEKYEVSETMIQSLFKKGFLNRISVPFSRVVVRDVPIHKKIRETKNENIVRLLNELENTKKPILYVPKDESEELNSIYQIINKYKKNEKNIVVLVPEILSSYRISNLIRKRTGLSVGVINSSLSSGELLDEFYEIKKNNYPIVVTSPSGALLPYQNVGVFILLNTESDNYYNDQSPRYNLKKVMIDYANLVGSKIVLSSFVPSIMDYTYGLKNYFQIIENSCHYDANIEVIDLKNELRMGNNSPLSLELMKTIETDASNKNVSIIIVNNKNFSSYVQCRTCGQTISCPKCKISFQYNRKSNMLICPSCSNRRIFSEKCEECGSSEWKMGGFGMEQVEEIIKLQFPNLKVRCLKESAYDEYYKTMLDIEEGNLHVLITTAMLSRDVDVENVGSITIINLDSVSRGLTVDANERAYAMLVQTRKHILNNSNARMLIQTYNPNDTFLIDFLTANYHIYLKNELSIRKLLKNEPFYFLNRIVVKGKYDIIFKEANAIKKSLQELLGSNIFVIGPTYNYQYQGVQIIIKHRIHDMSRYYKKIYEEYQTTSTTIIVDCYPKYM